MKYSEGKNSKPTNNTSRSSRPTDFRSVTYYQPDEGKDVFKRGKDLHVEYFRVGNLSYARSFYKYLNLETALKCIGNNTIQFVEPSRWKDQYERRFYEADYSLQDAKDEECPLLYSTCVTTTRFNEPSWVIYTYGKTGEGACCVEFQLNKRKFRQQLVKALCEMTQSNKKNKIDYKVYEGVVMYCSQPMIDRIHYKQVLEKGAYVDNKYYLKYVERRGENTKYLDNYLNLLLMKREAFKHENETRFFIVQSDKMGCEKAQKSDNNGLGGAILLRIDWVDIIEKVYINAKENSEEYKKLKEALFSKVQEKKLIDSDERKRMKDKVKPIPYFVYGEPLEEPLVMGEEKEPSDDNCSCTTEADGRGDINENINY